MDKAAAKKANVPLKWHGGKHYLAPRIVELMPPCVHYVEPYAGGLAVLLERDPEGVSEVVNDLNGDLMNFWTVLQSTHLFDEFRRVIEATPFSEATWERARKSLKELTSQVARAVAFFVFCRQSLAGRMKSFATLSRRRTRRGMNEQASAWWTAIEGLPEVHSRLKRVVLLNRPALAVIREQDGPDTLHYVDPPYLSETRTAPEVYDLEMTAADHFDLLQVLKECKVKVILSGYPSDLYTEELSHWRRVDVELPNNAAGGKEKRRMTECLWLNY